VIVEVPSDASGLLRKWMMQPGKNWQKPGLRLKLQRSQLNHKKRGDNILDTHIIVLYDKRIYLKDNFEKGKNEKTLFDCDVGWCPAFRNT